MQMLIKKMKSAASYIHSSSVINTFDFFSDSLDLGTKDIGCRFNCFGCGENA